MRFTHAQSVVDAATSRRSIRRFTAEPIPREDLREMVRVAGHAPSAFNIQPWRFVIVEDDALREQLAEAANGQRQVRSAPALIVMYSDMREALETVEETVHPGMSARREAVATGLRQRWSARPDVERESFGAGQSYIALGYLLLAAESMGYGTSPMLGFDAAKVKQLLGLPDHVVIPALVAVGVPDEEGFAPHRHSLDRIAQFR